MFKCFLLSHFLKEVPYFLTFYYFDHSVWWYWHNSAWCAAIYFQVTGEYPPKDMLHFAYFRSLLHLTTASFGRMHSQCTHKHTCHPWYYLPLDFIWWSWNRDLCVHRDTLLCSAQPRVPFFTLSLFHLQVSNSPLWEVGAGPRVFLLSPSWGNTLPHTDIVPVLSLKATLNNSMPFLRNNSSDIYVESSWCPWVFTFQVKHPQFLQSLLIGNGSEFLHHTSCFKNHKLLKRVCRSGNVVAP